MTGRERFLTAIENKKPDRLPCQVHSWMHYYLVNYLDGVDQFAAYDHFNMAPVIYTGPVYKFDERDLAHWQVTVDDRGTDNQGVRNWTETITTPGGSLRTVKASNKFTSWETEPLVKTKEDFEIFNKYFPVPIGVDGTNVKNAVAAVGDRGIVRGIIFCYGQMGAWQSFACLVGTEEAIMFAIDDPDWVHYVHQSLVDKQLKAIDLMPGEVPFDLIELGGGGGSNTVISPSMHEEFCVPYDKQQVDALHKHGYKVVYHLCGGLMKVLDLVVANGSDGLETMTPPGMGGDCDLAKATELVGDKLFFIGGFDQNQGFENGSPETIRRMVRELHESCPDGGYICSPSDHFFFGDPANIQAFVDACKECVY